MEETIAFQDWELLQSPAFGGGDGGRGNPKVSETDDISKYSAIKLDYFALDSKKPISSCPPSKEETEGGNLSWIDPDSDSRYNSRSGGRLNFSEDSSSDDSSDSQRSSPRGSNKTDLQNRREKEVNLGAGSELVKMGYGVGSGASNEPFSGGGGKGEKVWWKAPLEMIKFYVLRARPIWSVSIAAALVGAVMLGRRLYKLKYKARSVPLRIIFDDKKASQFMIRAVRLNEAFSAVRRVPAMRPPVPAGSGATPWHAVSFR